MFLAATIITLFLSVEPSAGEALEQPISDLVGTPLETLRDELEALSHSDWWMAIDGWQTKSNENYESEITSREAFTSEEAMQDPYLDLLSFIHTLAKSLANSDTISCRYPTKLRFIRSSLEKLDAPLREFLLYRIQKIPPCAEFEKALQLDAIDHLEFVMASASTSTPASMFGHLLLRPVYKMDRVTFGPGLSPWFQFAVLDDDFRAEGPFQRLWSGIIGSFEAQLTARKNYEIEKEHMVKLRRSFRRFPLLLSPEKIRHVMERLWEGLQMGKTYRYYFFQQNCASILVEFLRAALFPEFSDLQNHSIIVPPGRQLKTLASIRPPLIAAAFPDLLSREENTRLAIAERTRISQELKLDSHFDSHNPQERLATYQKLSILESRDFEFLIHSITLEEFDSDLRHHFEMDMDEVFDGLLNIYARQAQAHPSFAREANDKIQNWNEEKNREREKLESSRPSSDGYWNLGLGYDFASASAENSHVQHGLQIQTGLLHEELGSRSQTNSNPAGELKFFYGTLGILPEKPTVSHLDFTFLQYMSIKRPLPIIDSWKKYLSSWNLAISLAHERSLSQRWNFSPELDWILALYEKNEFSDHVLASVGMASPLDITLSHEGAGVQIQLPIGLRFRKQISFLHEAFLRVDLRAGPQMDIDEIDYFAKESCLAEMKIGRINSISSFFTMGFEHDFYHRVHSENEVSGFLGFRLAQ